MADFPTLKTGAVAQYPSDRSRVGSTRVQEFLDGSEQRWRQLSGSLKRWQIRLDQLTEEEMFRLEQFFVDEAGVAGSFSFTDPWDGSVHPDCSFESDAVGLVFQSVGRGQMTITIRENR